MKNVHTHHKLFSPCKGILMTSHIQILTLCVVSQVLYRDDYNNTKMADNQSRDFQRNFWLADFLLIALRGVFLQLINQLFFYFLNCTT